MLCLQKVNPGRELREPVSPSPKGSEQLLFHVVTAEDKVSAVARMLREIMPPLQAQLVMHSNATLQAHIKSPLT